MILVKKAGSREMTQFCHSNYAKETQTAVQSILLKGVKAGDLVGRNRLLRWYLWLCYSQRFCSLVWRSSVKYKKRNILLLFFLFFFFGKVFRPLLQNIIENLIPIIHFCTLFIECLYIVYRNALIGC